MMYVVVEQIVSMLAWQVTNVRRQSKVCRSCRTPYNGVCAMAVRMHVRQIVGLTSKASSRNLYCMKPDLSPHCRYLHASSRVTLLDRLSSDNTVDVDLDETAYCEYDASCKVERCRVYESSEFKEEKW